MNGMRQMQDPAFRLDWARRILKLHEQGTKIKPVELKAARVIVKQAKEGA